MAADASSLDVEAMARARSLLARPRRRESLWPVLGAAAFAAVSALAFATAMVLAPPVITEPIPASR